MFDDLQSLFALHLLRLQLLFLVQEHDFLLGITLLSRSVRRGLLYAVEARIILGSKTVAFLALHKAHHCVIADRLEVSVLREVQSLRVPHAQLLDVVHEVHDEAHVLEVRVLVVLKLDNYGLVVDQGPVT